MNARSPTPPSDRDPDETAFGVLPNRRRSRLVGALACRESPVALADVAAAVADRESSDPTDAEVRRVAIALHHVHLPWLADADVVGYDPETRTVTDVNTDSLPSLFATGD